MAEHISSLFQLISVISASKGLRILLAVLNIPARKANFSLQHMISVETVILILGCASSALCGKHLKHQFGRSEVTLFRQFFLEALKQTLCLLLTSDMHALPDISSS